MDVVDLCTAAELLPFLVLIAVKCVDFFAIVVYNNGTE